MQSEIQKTAEKILDECKILNVSTLLAIIGDYLYGYLAEEFPEFLPGQLVEDYYSCCYRVRDYVWKQEKEKEPIGWTYECLCLVWSNEPLDNLDFDGIMEVARDPQGSENSNHIVYFTFKDLRESTGVRITFNDSYFKEKEFEDDQDEAYYNKNNYGLGNEKRRCGACKDDDDEDWRGID